MENNQQALDQSKYLDNAIRAVRDKKPLPEIDFTLHTMEDGTQVSTLERVCKGMDDAVAIMSHAGLFASSPMILTMQTSADPAVSVRCSSACLPPAYPRPIPVTARPDEA